MCTHGCCQHRCLDKDCQMEKPKVISTQYYNWNYSGRTYRFVVQETGDSGTYEISLEMKLADTWSVPVFKHSMVCSSMPTFNSLAELTMRYFAKMFGIDYEEKE